MKLSQQKNSMKLSWTSSHVSVSTSVFSVDDGDAGCRNICCSFRRSTTWLGC